MTITIHVIKLFKGFVCKQQTIVIYFLQMNKKPAKPALRSVFPDLQLSPEVDAEEKDVFDFESPSKSPVSYQCKQFLFNFLQSFLIALSESHCFNISQITSFYF